MLFPFLQECTFQPRKNEKGATEACDIGALLPTASIVMHAALAFHELRQYIYTQTHGQT